MDVSRFVSNLFLTNRSAPFQHIVISYTMLKIVYDNKLRLLADSKLSML